MRNTCPGDVILFDTKTDEISLYSLTRDEIIKSNSVSKLGILKMQVVRNLPLILSTAAVTAAAVINNTLPSVASGYSMIAASIAFGASAGVKVGNEIHYSLRNNDVKKVYRTTLPLERKNLKGFETKKTPVSLSLTNEKM